MKLSKFSQKFDSSRGLVRLMDDIGKHAIRPGVKMLGGGNPSHIPAVQAHFRDRMARILDSENEFETMIGNYSSPNGHLDFNAAVAEFLSSQYGWPITPDHVVLTNGSQTAFFYLFNLLAGEFPDGSHKKILLPLAPEYIGYEDAGIEDDIFISYKSKIDILPNRMFKYHVDFDELEINDDIGAICVSRPTNPTGNVLTADEMDKLSALAKENDVPFIIDNAYGLPFPSIIFTGEEPPMWEPHMIMCMSLSKLGLPGVRTGIIIADPALCTLISNMNAILSLAPTSVGGALALDIVRSGEISEISRNFIQPHYQRSAERAVTWLHQYCEGLDYYVHVPEGAIFVWAWFRGLPITSLELYDRLKARDVLVIPGQNFFPGLTEPWDHQYECLRLSHAMDPADVEAGIRIIGEEVKKAFAEAGVAV